jgi:hypothetical protein
MTNKNSKLGIIIYSGILLLVCAIFLREKIQRCLWYDEALTIIDFVAGPSTYIGIYRQYVIPNNHILYSVFMRFWMHNVCPFISFSNYSFRLPSMIAAFAFLLSSFLFWRKHFSDFSVFIVLLAFTVSPAFLIYAVAVRGYMFSILTVSLAIIAVFKVCENRKTWFPAYCLLSLISVGIMPTNAFAIFAVSLLPFVFGKAKITFPNFLKFSSVPFIALLCFYLPIFPQFIKTISIKEGWSSGFAAIGVFYFSTFIILLIPSASAIFSLTIPKKGEIIEGLLCVFIFIIPAFFFILRSPAPFPRTFISLLPVWLFLLSAGVHALEKKIPEKCGQRFANFATLFLTMICMGYGLILNSNKTTLSAVFSKDGQDDFFEPYFMKNDFQPDGITINLMKLTDKKEGIVFADMNSDPPSLIFSSLRFGLKNNFILCDRPRTKIALFPQNYEEKEAFIIASGKDRAESVSSRFGLEILSEEGGFGSQKIFRVGKTGM